MLLTLGSFFALEAGQVQVSGQWRASQQDVVSLIRYIKHHLNETVPRIDLGSPILFFGVCGPSFSISYGFQVERGREAALGRGMQEKALNRTVDQDPVCPELPL